MSYFPFYVSLANMKCQTCWRESWKLSCIWLSWEIGFSLLRCAFRGDILIKILARSLIIRFFFKRPYLRHNCFVLNVWSFLEAVDLGCVGNHVWSVVIGEEAVWNRLPAWLNSDLIDSLHILIIILKYQFHQPFSALTLAPQEKH